MTNTTIRLALVQTARDRFDKEKNLKNAERLLGGIRDVDIVCFPENWVGAVVLEDSETTYVLGMVSRYARAGSYTALSGSLVTRRDGHIIAAGHVISPNGNILGHTEKIFPSFAVGERGFIQPGEHLPIFEVNDLRFGVLICVDLFYPELARSLALRGAQILFNPSNIPKSRISLWRALVSARAAENTVYVVFTNNTKSFYPDNREVNGHSMVATPWGDILFEADEEEGAHVVGVDLSQLVEVRQRWPYIADIKSLECIDGDQVSRKP